jgi:hypothetical protein
MPVPACIADTLHIDGLPAGIDAIEVRSTLLGPLPKLPELESTPDDWRDFPVAGRTTTSVSSNGDHPSACLPVTRPGHYYFVTESDGSTPATLPASTTPTAEAVEGETVEDDTVEVSLVPEFADHRVHAPEAISLTAPPMAPPATTPPPAAPAPPAATGRLPLTGSPAGPTAMATATAVGALVLGLALAGLAGATIPTRRR